MLNNNKYMVVTICYTYNQASYILDTLKGFIIQQTTFPSVFIVIDDASTDGEPDLLRHWADDNLDFTDIENSIRKETSFGEIFYAKHKDNPHNFFTILLLSENHYDKESLKLSYVEDWTRNSKYIAFCEGDDYWIDSFKLQKQVNFLEDHNDYGLVHSNFRVIDDVGEEIGSLKERESLLSKYEGDAYERILRQLNIKTLTFCIREKYWPRQKIAADVFSGDKYIAMNVALQSKIHYMSDVTGVYRSLKGTSSHSLNFIIADSFKRSVKKLDEYYLSSIPGLSTKTRKLVMFRWGVYDMIYKIAKNDRTIKKLPNLLTAIPYIKVKDYKFIFIYILAHTRVFFNIFHRKLLSKSYYYPQI